MDQISDPYAMHFRNPITVQVHIHRWDIIAFAMYSGILNYFVSHLYDIDQRYTPTWGKNII